jgi:L-malate glycosyltransferase
MRVLVFAHDSSMYGASQSLITLLEGIHNKQDRKLLVLLPYRGKIEEVLSSMGIEYQIVTYPRCVILKRDVKSVRNYVKSQIKYYWNNFKIYRRLEGIIDSFNPDVIYTNTSVVELGYRLAKSNNIPHVWHVREFGDIFFYFPYKNFIRRCMRSSQKVIFNSNALKYSWLSDCQSDVVYNGIVDTANHKYSPRSLPIGNIRVGLVGAIIPLKGHKIAIEAISILLKDIPGCSLFIYGDFIDKPYSKELISFINSLGLSEKVNFKGFVDNQDFIYTDLDLLLNCSHNEGFGRTLIEAMMRGVPVISNKSGGVLEIIDDGINGLFFDGDSSFLAKKIRALLTNETLYNSLSVNGIERSKDFSVAKYVDSIDEILVGASEHKR